MSGDRAPVSRCITVWLVVSAASAGTLRWSGARAAVGDLRTTAGGSFEELLPGLASIALGACALWLWVVATMLLLGAARGADWSVPGCPAVLRRGLLGACGLAMVASPAWAAAPDVPRSPDARLSVAQLAGLPLPDRATGKDVPRAAPVRVAVPAPAPARTVVVRPGDTLWGLAAAALPPTASDAEITAGWHAVYAANRDVLDDPDLIHPGTRLTLPDLTRTTALPDTLPVTLPVTEEKP